jgi:hypothetical protein
VEETGVPGENHRPVASHLQTWSHPAIYADEHWMALSISLVMVVDPWRCLTSFLVMVDKKGIVDLSCIFEKEELDLVKSLLELILCISLCSCKDFQDLTPKKQKSLHHFTKQGRGTRSEPSWYCLAVCWTLVNFSLNAARSWIIVIPAISHTLCARFRFNFENFILKKKMYYMYYICNFLHAALFMQCI